jgi:hypothetical protein
MARKLARALLALQLMAIAVPACAQDGTADEVVQRIYAGIENNVRADYEALRARLSATAMRLALPAAKEREELKMLSYNKAALFASCVMESQLERSPVARRVPSAENLVLRTCTEIKFAEMEKFSSRLAYAEVFFPDRIPRCDKAARLPALEKLLPPFDFLELAEPKLYDFARYNQCLMSP